METDGLGIFKFCTLYCDEDDANCKRQFLREKGSAPFVFGVDQYNCRMPCGSACQTTIITDLSVKPYGDFFYELVAQGRLNGTPIAFVLTTGQIQLPVQDATTNVLYLGGKVHKLEKFEWAGMGEKDGERRAFYEGVRIHNEVCWISFKSSDNYGDVVNVAGVFKSNNLGASGAIEGNCTVGAQVVSFANIDTVIYKYSNWW